MAKWQLKDDTIHIKLSKELSFANFSLQNVS